MGILPFIVLNIKHLLIELNGARRNLFVLIVLPIIEQTIASVIMLIVIIGLANSAVKKVMLVLCVRLVLL